MKKTIISLVFLIQVHGIAFAKTYNFTQCVSCWNIFQYYFDMPESEYGSSENSKAVSDFLEKKFKGQNRSYILNFLETKKIPMRPHIRRENDEIVLSFLFPQDDYYVVYRVWIHFNEDDTVLKIIYGESTDYTDSPKKLMFQNGDSP